MILINAEGVLLLWQCQKRKVLTHVCKQTCAMFLLVRFFLCVTWIIYYTMIFRVKRIWFLTKKKMRKTGKKKGERTKRQNKRSDDNQRTGVPKIPKKRKEVKMTLQD